eukprot:s206_g9.t1
MHCPRSRRFQGELSTTDLEWLLFFAHREAQAKHWPKAGKPAAAQPRGDLDSLDVLWVIYLAKKKLDKIDTAKTWTGGVLTPALCGDARDEARAHGVPKVHGHVRERSRGCALDQAPVEKKKVSSNYT